MKYEVSEALFVLELLIMPLLFRGSANASCAGRTEQVTSCQLTFSEAKSRWKNELIHFHLQQCLQHNYCYFEENNLFPIKLN